MYYQNILKFVLKIYSENYNKVYKIYILNSTQLIYV